MSKSIESGKWTINELFSHWYTIPEYQRPYVWGKDQVTDLLDDISYAQSNTPDAEYFLGSIVFHDKVKQNFPSQAFDEKDLLDGQQRLTTLFILMAYGRDYTENKELIESCATKVYQKGNTFNNVPERLRIQFKIRREVEDFANTFLKGEERGTKKLTTKDLTKIEEFANEKKDVSINNIVIAIKTIVNYFGSDHEKVENFFKYLNTKVVLIFVASKNLEDAFRLFTILNDRGVHLRNADILKSQNLAEISNKERMKEFAKLWELWENELQESFDRFLAIVRTCLVKEKARKSILKEFEEKIYKDNNYEKRALLKYGEETFEVLEKYKNSYDYVLNDNNENIRFRNLVQMASDAIPSSEWLAPIVFYHTKFRIEGLADFTEKVLAKVSGDLILQKTPTKRIENINEILKSVSKATSVTEIENKVFNTDDDLEDIFKVLKGDIYGRSFTKFVLLVLDYLYTDKEESLPSYNTISVEHILPQNPAPDSQWCKDFKKNEEKNDFEWIHKIGNLVLLGRRKNTSQGRMDYRDKVKNYFRSRISMFKNSNRIITTYKTWTPKDVEINHNEVLDKLKEFYKTY